MFWHSRNPTPQELEKFRRDAVRRIQDRRNLERLERKLEMWEVDWLGCPISVADLCAEQDAGNCYKSALPSR